MGYKYLINAVVTYRYMVEQILKEGDTAVDCTVGNGNDTVLLAEKVGPKGKVYGFDIQKKALDITYNKLKERKLEDRVILINDDHKNLGKYINNMVKLGIFNLGYLPKGDRSIVTRKETTLQGILQLLNLLQNNGMAFIASYTGHREGYIENKGIEDFLKKLNQKKFGVVKFDFINQINTPPILYEIEKL